MSKEGSMPEAWLDLVRASEADIAAWASGERRPAAATTKRRGRPTHNDTGALLLMAVVVAKRLREGAPITDRAAARLAAAALDMRPRNVGPVAIEDRLRRKFRRSRAALLSGVTKI